MADRWFRLYEDAVIDPKVQSLPLPLFKFWINLLCIASKNDGVIPPEDQLKSVLALRYDHLKRGLKELLTRGLIDVVEGRMEPHNWQKRQYKTDTNDPTNAERQQRYRDRNRNGNAVTPKRPETDTETERVKNILNNKNILNSCADTLFSIVPGQPEWDAWERHYLKQKKSLPLAMQRVKDGQQKGMTVPTRFPP